MIAHGGPATLLLVDDSTANLTALEAALEPLGYRLISVTSGDLALRRLLKDDVSVILLDVRMPGMDGFETAKRIKERELTAEIPIIFMSAVSTQSGDVLEGFTTGAVDYVTKPVDPALLRAKVHVFVDLAQKSRLLRQQSEVLSRQLEERYAQQAMGLRKLADAALAINSTLSLDEMLTVINDSAREIIGAHEAETVITARADLGTPELSRSFSPKYAGWASEGRHLDLNPVWSFVVTGGTVVRMTKDEVERSLAARGLADATIGHPLLEGWLAVPIVSRDQETVGLIQVADKGEGDFTADDEVVLLQLAQLAAVAIGNAERYAQEHLVAETLQRAMLPRRLPVVKGLELASRYVAGGGGTRVGGDWYDTVVMDDGRIMLAVGDVVGRGPRAAAIMGQLRTAMRAYALQQLPATVLMRSLDLLLQDFAEEAIATAACLMLDPSTGVVEAVLAGHPPPLIIDPAGNTRFLESDTHVPMGVRDAPLYLSSYTPFEAGSTMLMFTDGLVESRTRPVGKGMQDLSQVLAGVGHSTDVEELCDAILESMVQGTHDDDIALLAVRRLPTE
ncbi:MAG TPA: SpoIIE family protein phosphatase [Acidimicrobiales bacterium]|nr:SpoIIE family protein phosphatase [Acidimicrobiales bacterium]